MNDLRQPHGEGDLLKRLEQLNRIGIALSQERDITRLLETILIAAKDITRADGGTLYRMTEDRTLQFEIIRNDTLGIAMGGTTGVEIPFYPIYLFDQDGKAVNTMVAAYAVHHDQSVNIADAYTEEGFDFTGTKNFDKKTGYRSTSFLTVPMKNHENEIIGVLQLINAKDLATGKVVPFSETDQQLAESLASQAAIALTNRLLINQLEELFESFINLINTAIDDKSPYTGGHCQRVPVLTMMLAEVAIKADSGPLKNFALDEKQLYELKLAGLLHDCGKVTTPVHVVDKSTKLQTIYDRINLVDARFEILKRDAEIELLEARLAARERGGDTGALERAFGERLARLADDREFLRKCNIGGEFMTPQQQERVRKIAQYPWRDDRGQSANFLTEDEIHNLSISRGTLTHEDREIINNHVAMTYKMLSALPWPKHLKNVAEYAASHHERLDGKGYHRGLTGDRLSMQARIIAIADVFEALTAKDRPYKPGKTLTESLQILGRMAQESHIDPHLFDVFMREKVYLKYARQFLDPAQIDDVDVGKIPGYVPPPAR
ncbi:MAG: GAF domain-containing protein [Betaproteobacteria bacterium]|nr:GAF domain-containing protein [Betaproteobacteria bacterium]